MSMTKNYTVDLSIEKQFKFLLDNTDDMIMKITSDGVIDYASPSVSKYLGLLEQNVISKNIRDFVKDTANIDAILKQNDLQNTWYQFDLKIQEKNASCLNFLFSRVEQEIFVIMRDVNKKIRSSDEVIKAIELDELTGIPNRTILMRELEGFYQKRAMQAFTVLKFDMDRFKQINESFGHVAGDASLCQFVSRIKSVLRPTDVFARFGGDEFVAILDGKVSEEKLYEIMSRIKDRVEESFIYEGTVLYPKISIGAALSDVNDESIDDILTRADSAMYTAKQLGGSMSIIYDTSVESVRKRDLLIENEVIEALKNDRILVYYQPILDSQSNEINHAEALVRIKKEDDKLMPPNDFIPVVEKTNLIHLLGERVLYLACKHAKYLKDNGSEVIISVNVSPKQLMHSSFIDTVSKVLLETQVEPSLIVLEITESSMMLDIAKVKLVVDKIKSLGFGLALDDFGTGHSSLSVLRTLPFDYLKIDKSFIDEIMEPINLVSSIVNIGKRLKMKIVAEGVEKESQHTTLFLMDCDLMQGYFFHRPMPAQEHINLVFSKRKEAK